MFAGQAHSKAMSYATRGEYGPALWGFRRAVVLDSKKSAHWNDLGVTLLRVQRFPAAEAAFLASLARDSGNHDAANNLVETRDFMKRAGEGASTIIDAGGVTAGGGDDALALVLTPEFQQLSQLVPAAHHG